MPQRFKGRVPQLYHVYKVNDLAAAWMPWLTYPFSTIDLPTEFVISKPGFYVPTQARVYATDLYVHPDGRLVDYVELASIPDFHGTGEHPSVLMAEVWEDWGDDGHVRPSLMGWKFINGKEYDEACKRGRSLQYFGSWENPLYRFVGRDDCV